MVQAISVLGSTGSIGRQTLAAAKRLGIPVLALSARRDVDRIEEQARAVHPRIVAMTEAEAARELALRLSDTDIDVLSGEAGLCAAACFEGADCVVTGVSGSVGLRPTLAAIREGKRIALANKETLVCAGSLVMREAARCGAEIIPVDSEHSAIFQCLTGRDRSELRRILLTGSGGPFRGKKWAELSSVTPEEAVRHPNWSMGAKISVDSATMMNKGLEYIEAMHLFGVSPEQLRILIHPESAVHSMVELRDGAIIAQLGTPDMGIPIQYALSWPERGENAAESLDLTKLAALHFTEPDYEELPCLRLAMECAASPGTAAAVLSAANEAAVGLFLAHRITYHQIYDLVASAVDALAVGGEASLDELIDCDRAARRHVFSEIE